MKDVLKKITTLGFVFSLLCLSFMYVIKDEAKLKENIAEEECLTFIDRDGNVVCAKPTTKVSPLLENAGATAGSLDLVRFTYTADTTPFTDYYTGVAGYLSAYYIEDAAFVKYEGDDVIAVMSGAKIRVNKKYVQVMPLTSVKSTSFYRKEKGILYHYTSLNLMAENVTYANKVGGGVSNMQEGVKYYSYDGHYFWTDYQKMLTDYRAGNYNNSINNGKPYYNYFQFLSHRSTTGINDAAFNAFTNAQLGNTASALKNQGAAFIKAQNTYGTNALLMFGVAINESAWGTSNYAKTRNNLFGHAAYDSDPNQAASYASILDCVNQHAKSYVSGYANPRDWRNFGAHLGDKQSGMNVKYASDPYWGEKAANHAWSIANTYPHVKEDSRYALGVKNSTDVVNVRNQATTSSTVLYNTKNTVNFPVIIIGTSGSWYKIAADYPLNSARTSLANSPEYTSSRDYAFIHADYISKVSTGGGIVVPTYKKGDVNLDGKVSPSDYMSVKNHIINKYVLTGDKLKQADVNGDGKVSPADFMSVKNIILGK
ncbi:hypothetical protein A4S06_08285 [Erysipelotrichaceae bacterium MTC7]|nr:hypothetical protein A4S06_08285 [Erysipelotrichaceae bacterium MTC7]